MFSPMSFSRIGSSLQQYMFRDGRRCPSRMPQLVILHDHVTLLWHVFVVSWFPKAMNERLGCEWELNKKHKRYQMFVSRLQDFPQSANLTLVHIYQGLLHTCMPGLLIFYEGFNFTSMRVSSLQQRMFRDGKRCFPLCKSFISGYRHFPRVRIWR